MKFNISSSLAFIALFAIVLAACTDPIDIDLDEGTPQLNVDAFLNDKPEEQKVRLLMTTNYFDNESINAISDATVTLTSELQEEWTFTYDKDGYYVLPHTPGDTLIRPFVNYTLWIKHDGATFTAGALSMPTTIVDSITFEEQVPSGPGSLDGFIGEFWARDIAGMPNFYWIQTYKNDTFISDPNFINVAFDAAQGEGADGLTFIPPIRTGINTFPNIFEKDDNVRVEIHGISFETYQFIFQAQSQITNGGLFATPPYNVVTNIENVNGSDEAKDKAVGWFSVATVSSREAVAQ